MRRRSRTAPTLADDGAFDAQADAQALAEGDPAAAVVEPERPSKTRLKQQAHDLQALGRELAEMPADRLDRLDLPEALRSAIDELRRTRSHEGRRRQWQYVGKQMRQVDAEPLREAVAAWKLGSAEETLQLHEAERWRSELIASDEALTRWAGLHPASDLQRLRSLVRTVRKEAVASPEQRHGRGYRELFQFIKPWLAGAGQAQAPHPSAPPDPEA